MRRSGGGVKTKEDESTEGEDQKGKRDGEEKGGKGEGGERKVKKRNGGKERGGRSIFMTIHSLCIDFIMLRSYDIT